MVRKIQGYLIEKAKIVDDLASALEQFRLITNDLEKK